MSKRNVEHGKDYRTAGALLAARFRAEVRHYMGTGHTKSDAERLALRDSEAWDVVIQNPDGTFRFPEPDEDGLSPSPAVTADN